MDTQVSHSQLGPQFQPGSSVVYALHGKCQVLSVELRQIGAESILFYKLEVQKSALSRSQRQEPAIWLPVSSAKDRGLRAPMTREEAEAALALLMSREYYFPVNESWSSVHPKLESAIRSEGGPGLAKVVSYLHVLKHKLIVPPAEVTKLSESVGKVLMRELSEALGEPIRVLDEKIQKGFRQKTLRDN